MKKIIKRWKSKMPKFWKRVLIFATALGGAAVSLKFGIKQFDLILPAIIVTACDYAIAVACTLGLAAKITKVD